VHILSGPRRVDLQINTLPQPVRVYIAELETELERCQRKLAARRKQDRDRDRKLELANLKRELCASYVQRPVTNITNVSPYEAGVRRVVDEQLASAAQTQRAAV